MKYIKTFESFYFEPKWKLRHFIDKNLEFYEDPYNEKKFQEIIKRLESDCKPFIDLLKRSNSNLFFRGVSSTNDVSSDIELRKVRKDRIPKDIDREVHDIINDRLLKKFGVAFRENGVFATKNYDTSLHYGKPYIFFPKGDFEYYWNLSINDLFSELEFDGFYHFYAYRDELDQLEGLFPEEFQEIDGRITDLSDKSQSQINDLIDRAISKFEKKIDSIVDGYKSDHFQDIKNQEVTFVCDEYYLVSRDYLRNFYDYFGIIFKL